MEFIARASSKSSDVVEVCYDCACGCKPSASYKRGSDEANYEHCCCGQVHFVGARAEARLKAYLKERSAQGLDAEVGGYSIQTVELQAPWGAPVLVAFAVPEIAKEH